MNLTSETLSGILQEASDTKFLWIDMQQRYFFFFIFFDSILIMIGYKNYYSKQLQNSWYLGTFQMHTFFICIISEQISTYLDFLVWKKENVTVFFNIFFVIKQVNVDSIKKKISLNLVGT